MNRKWRKRLVIAGGVLLLSIPAALLVGKYWIVPSVLRHQASVAVREQWDGDLTIAGINFNWTGPTYLRGVELRDAEGRVWLRAGSVKLALRNWPGLHPVLSEVEVENLDLRGFFAGGELQLPLKPPPPRDRKDEEKDEEFDLPTITIRNMSVGIVAEKSSQTAWGDVQLTLRREGQNLLIELTRTFKEPGEELALSGTVDGQSLEADLALTMKHAVTREEAAAILAALNVPFFSRMEGKIDAKMGLRGGLAAPSALTPSGTIALADWSISSPHGLLFGGLSGEVRFDGRAPAGAVAELSAQSCSGQVKAAATVNVLADGTLRYRGRVEAEKVSFDELPKVLSGVQETRKGTLEFAYAFDGYTRTPGGPAQKGYVYLNNADLANVPLLTALFRLMRLTQFDALQATDVEATFTMKGLVATVSQARLANAVAAIDVEPGGQVDLGTRHLDLYLIAAPIKQIQDFLGSIPLVSLVVRLKDKLTRVHVRGDWDAPPASLMSKQPLNDVAEGTVGFLRGVASTGGRLGKSLFKTFGDILDKP
ncbi:MAG TPA: AsmA-like C-terminal domain-containing protein [Planctomycetota bacterium]|nr:AsmA-like C-terminal domain-containing protein [Planctomycetota bacterium]